MKISSVHNGREHMRKPFAIYLTYVNKSLAVYMTSLYDYFFKIRSNDSVNGIERAAIRSQK